MGKIIVSLGTIVLVMVSYVMVPGVMLRSLKYE